MDEHSQQMHNAVRLVIESDEQQAMGLARVGDTAAGAGTRVTD